MFDEQEHYRQHLLSLPPEEILNSAYAYTTREDILLSLEYNDLTDKQCQALLKSPCPLSDVFRAWEKYESSHMEELLVCCRQSRQYGHSGGKGKNPTGRSDSPWHTSPRRIFSRQNSWIC